MMKTVNIKIDLLHKHSYNNCVFNSRLAQYACRALWDSLPTNDAHGEYVHRLKSLEYILSSFRKRTFAPHTYNSQ